MQYLIRYIDHTFPDSDSQHECKNFVEVITVLHNLLRSTSITDIKVYEIKRMDLPLP